MDNYKKISVYIWLWLYAIIIILSISFLLWDCYNSNEIINSQVYIQSALIETTDIDSPHYIIQFCLELIDRMIFSFLFGQLWLYIVMLLFNQ